ncbi:hypothetical protein F5Y19DRAFT_488263 [Xylariaceae sp. FL1651]|nr:hypothetical protein F5Y19DRAFT_488263 [Xylariaceae sp. FL1651]
MQSSASIGADYPVQLGFWVNWSYGRVLGSTLTLTREDANLFIILTALFITVVTSHIWNIVCFGWHISYSTQARIKQTIFYHQRQAILRNNSGPFGTFWSFVQIAWLSRHQPGPFLRIIPVLLLTILFASSLTIATVFSSQLAIGSEVLINGSRCGVLSDSQNGTDVLTVLMPWLARQTTISASYSQQCYDGAQISTLAPPERCHTSPFIQRQLKQQVDSNAMCPFRAICRSNTSNLVLDTGLVDSHSDLGINAPSHQRFSFREVLRCAPINTDGRKKRHILSEDRSYSRYYFGQPLWSIRPDAYTPENVTYQYPDDLNTRARITNLNYAWPDYTLEVLSAYTTNGEVLDDGLSMFLPIDELRHSDADLFLFFLSTNSIGFSVAPTDNWYYPDKEPHGVLAGANSMPINTSDPSFVPLAYSFEAASPLACTSQQQICTSEGMSCTPLGSAADTMYASKELFQDKDMLQAVYWVNAALGQGASIFQVVEALKSYALTSRPSLYDGVQGEIASNQWQLDVQYWHSVSLAAAQAAVVNAAAGMFPDNESSIKRPSTVTEQRLCHSQKINNPAYVSFTVFGLGFVLAFGLLTIATSLSIEFLFGCIQRRRKFSPFARLEWLSNGALQLQRLAHEPLISGKWSRCTETVPYVEGTTNLAILDVLDEDHPVLKSQTADDSNVSIFGSVTEVDEYDV